MNNRHQRPMNFGMQDPNLQKGHWYRVDEVSFVDVFDANLAAEFATHDRFDLNGYSDLGTPVMHNTVTAELIRPGIADSQPLSGPQMAL